MFSYMRVVYFMALFPISSLTTELTPDFRADFEYVEEFDAFYKKLSKLLSWYDAFNACMADGSRLAFPRTPNEATFLKKYVASPSWLGAIKNNEKMLTTVEGEKLWETHFRRLNVETNPDKGGQECLIMSSDMKVSKVSCFATKRAVCRKIRPIDPCPELCIAPGYVADPNRRSCYKVHTDRKRWEDARRVCEREDAHLVVLNDKREVSFLIQMLKDNRTKTENVENHLVSIGFHDLNTEGLYETVDGQMLNETGYTEWYPNEPSAKDSNHDEDCGSMWRNFGLLNDINCNYSLAFICEREVNLPVWSSD